MVKVMFSRYLDCAGENACLWLLQARTYVRKSFSMLWEIKRANVIIEYFFRKYGCR